MALGTQSWSYPEWAGPMYDAGTRPDGHLREYVRWAGRKRSAKRRRYDALGVAHARPKRIEQTSLFER